MYVYMHACIANPQLKLPLLQLPPSYVISIIAVSSSDHDESHNSLWFSTRFVAAQ